MTLLAGLLCSPGSPASDHNDPNAVNSIFSDVPASAADLYDMFGFPSPDTAGGDKVVLALTFASVPQAGVFDTDMIYRILLAADPRVAPPLKGEESLDAMLAHFKAVESKYLRIKPSEVRVKVDKDGRATIKFIDFVGGSFSKVIDTNKVETLQAPDGSSIKAFVGGRDDPFFNDLTGFFRSIHYAPQFYRVPQAMADTRELPIPKSLLELAGNDWFNFDPKNPQHGYTVKKDLPASPMTWSGSTFAKNDKGNYRFMYSGRDAQAGRNVNTVTVEIPLAYLTKSPQTDRVVNSWGESWVSKASRKIASIPDEGAALTGQFWVAHPWLVPGVVIVLGVGCLLLAAKASRKPRPVASAGALPVVRWWGRPFVLTGLGAFLIVGGGVTGAVTSAVTGQNDIFQARYDEELKDYKLVDTDGQPFADAALNERENKRQLGANNFWLGPHFIARLAHLGWGFGPSISALGLATSFDHKNAPVSVHKVYSEALSDLAEAFPLVRKTLFQELNMPDDRWNPKRLNIPLKRSFEIFVPNVVAIDMDTTGTWPYGHRLDDQVATRFLSLFLDMKAEAGGKKYHIEILSDQAVLDQLPLEPHTPPNPLKNDREYLKEFPYLAEPWSATKY
jgi:hypothetical protein